MSVVRLQSIERADKRDVILRVAAQYFNKTGFDDTRLEDVAHALGSTKASISYHFKSKQALLEAAYTKTCDRYDLLLADSESAKTGIAKIEAWITGLGKTHSQILSGQREPLAFLNDVSALGETKADYFARRAGDQLAAVTRFLEQGAADGTINSDEHTGRAYFIWNIAHWIESWLSNIPPVQHDAAINGLLDTLRTGIIANRGTSIEHSPSLHEGDASSALFNREARARLKKEAFERAGIRAFNRFGYTNISLNNLARDLGASRGSIYYSFGDKDELLEACSDRSLRHFERAIENAMAQQTTAVEKLFQACSALYSGHFSDLDPILRPTLFWSLSISKQAVSEAEMQHSTARLAQIVAQCINDRSGMSRIAPKLEVMLVSVIQSLAPHRRIISADNGGITAAPTSSSFLGTIFTGLSPVASQSSE